MSETKIVALVATALWTLAFAGVYLMPIRWGVYFLFLTPLAGCLSALCIKEYLDIKFYPPLKPYGTWPPKDDDKNR